MSESVPATLAVIRIRREHSRTYWLVADADRALAFSPHVSLQTAVRRFQEATGRTHARVEVYREHHGIDAAHAIVRALFGRTR